MTAFGQELLNDVGASFRNKLEKDRKLRSLAKRIRDGTDFTDVNKYSVRLGECLSESFLENTESLAFMSEEVAREVLPPMMTLDYDLMSTVATTAQENINKAEGVGLAVLVPELNKESIERLVMQVGMYSTFDEARYLFEEPLINFTQQVADRSLEMNTEASARVGLRSTITRKLSGREVTKGLKQVRSKKGKVYRYPYSRYSDEYTYPCPFCQERAGTFEYDKDSIDEEIFRRHPRCRCTLTVKRGKMYQDAWSKAEWSEDKANARAEAIQQKQAEIQAEEARRESARQKRLSDLEYLMTKTGYSAKSASIKLNQYKDEVADWGVDWLVDKLRMENPLIG